MKEAERAKHEKHKIRSRNSESILEENMNIVKEKTQSRVSINQDSDIEAYISKTKFNDVNFKYFDDL